VIQKMKKMKKIEEHCNFQFLAEFFAPLEAKTMKHDKKNEK